MITFRPLALACTCAVALLALNSPGAAQDAKKADAKSKGQRNFGPPPVVSPEVHSDHKVTFRIRAPKASEVSVNGDWGNAELKKDDQGVWSATVGPMTPDFYTYTFVVDGVRTLDQSNGMLKPGLQGAASMVEVTGDEEAFEATKDVPHGTIHTTTYRSKTLDAQRSVHVYTPPGYESGSDKYPVLYLLHGAGDDDNGWSTVGRAGFILDNLIAAKKAKGMIVVMPNGSLPRPTNMPRVAPGTQPTPEMRPGMAAMQNRFTDELLKEVVPFAESNYRIQTGAKNRALAGLSMGGGRDAARSDDASGRICLRFDLEPGFLAGRRTISRRTTPISSAIHRRSTRTSNCSRFASAARTSHSMGRRACPSFSTNTRSSTRCIQVVEDTPGSTGGIISPSLREVVPIVFM